MSSPEPEYQNARQYASYVYQHLIDEFFPGRALIGQNYQTGDVLTSPVGLDDGTFSNLVVGVSAATNGHLSFVVTGHLLWRVHQVREFRIQWGGLNIPENVRFQTSWGVRAIEAVVESRDLVTNKDSWRGWSMAPGRGSEKDIRYLVGTHVARKFPEIAGLVKATPVYRVAMAWYANWLMDDADHLTDKAKAEVSQAEKLAIGLWGSEKR